MCTQISTQKIWKHRVLYNSVETQFVPRNCTFVIFFDTLLTESHQLDDSRKP